MRCTPDKNNNFTGPYPEPLKRNTRAGCGHRTVNACCSGAKSSPRSSSVVEEEGVCRLEGGATHPRGVRKCWRGTRQNRPANGGVAGVVLERDVYA